MKQQKLAALLIAGALILAAGAYVLFTQSNIKDAEFRHTVNPPQEGVSAPSWVDNGQEAAPDYSSTDAEAQDATPATEDQINQPQIIEVTEDKTVTLGFVESLANYLLSHFTPKDISGSPATYASAKSANIYFGQSLEGFSVPVDNIRAARKSVLDYAFTSPMLQTLQNIYSPAFIAILADKATSEDRKYKVSGSYETRTLTQKETAAMFRLNASVFEQTAAIFRIIATDPSLTALAGKYLQNSKAVERANGTLQNAIAEEKGTVEAGQRLKQAILQREQVKSTMIKHIRKQCATCPSSEAFYLTQWAYRRVLNEPDEKLAIFSTAADVLTGLAQQFTAQATVMMNQ